MLLNLYKTFVEDIINRTKLSAIALEPTVANANEEGK